MNIIPDSSKAINKLIKQTLILLVGFLFSGCLNNKAFHNTDAKVKIQWVDNLVGDFNFRTKWNYPEGVYRNSYGQLSCDAFCPEGAELMKNMEGKIYADSLAKFYQLVDTSHQYHTMSCEAWCYEWAGSDFISAKQINNDQIRCSTHTNAGTHCSLILEITSDWCSPKIELLSISSPGLKTYFYKSGHIKIDKRSLAQGILKTEFNFDFNNTDEPEQNIYWKGKVYTMIEKI